jgi:hypothetical protein
LRRGLLYDSYVQEVIVKILGFSFNYYFFIFGFRPDLAKCYKKIAFEGSKHMATKRRSMIAFNSLTITFAEFRAVEVLIVDSMEFAVDFIDMWGRVFSFAKDAPAVDGMKDGVKLMRLVRETTIVMENVLGPLATCGL